MEKYSRMRPLLLLCLCLLVLVPSSPAASLPLSTVFKGVSKFDNLVRRAQAAQWDRLPIGERVTAVGLALVGTPYKGFTLEIDDRIEAPSVNLYGLDCWTFFESALAFARMLDEPRERWTPATMLQYIELDRYRDGRCTGDYLSRLHYLEDWAHDNQRRGLVDDLTRSLGGDRVPHSTGEMTINWKSYRYLRNNPSLRRPIAQMEARVAATPFYQIPKSQVGSIEGKIRNGDIIGICGRDGRGYSTSHVGLAYRDRKGVLRFMHASSPRNHGRVVLDSRLKDYLYRYSSHSGIIVCRPLK